MTDEGYTEDDWIFNYGNEEIIAWEGKVGELQGFEADLYQAYFSLE
jgi:hypothetical protein